MHVNPTVLPEGKRETSRQRDYATGFRKTCVEPVWTIDFRRGTNGFIRIGYALLEGHILLT